MELFTVNRYTGEGVGKAAATDENEILQELLRKAEKRKRKANKRKSEEAPKVEEPEEIPPAEEATALEDDIQDEGLADVDPINAEGADALVGYEILGTDATDEAKKPKIDVVLPPWLAHPTIISTTIAEGGSEDAAKDEEGIAQLPFLADHTRQALKEMNVSRLFPVQSAVIPWILESHGKPTPFRPRDICVSAPTGSGKTLAFAIPIVQLLEARVDRRVRALVVLPVAELALQVFKVFKKLCEKTILTVGLLSKQVPFPLEQERLVEHYNGEYHSKVDIVVTTPGRLVDHLHATRGFCLKSLRFLVIDEADRIMDAVFQNWLYHLDAHVRTTSDQLLSGRAAPLCFNELKKSAATQPHKLLFSATLSQDPEKLQGLRLFQPKLFTSVLKSLETLREKFASAAAEDQESLVARGDFIGKYTTPAELSEKYCITESRLKPLTLYSLIKENNWSKFLCFTNSNEAAGRLTFVLQHLFKKSKIIEELTAVKSPNLRADLLKKFSQGKINGLICSDALARGIDIPEVDIVISYDCPRHVKTYIHRIGRTARAGHLGTAITLLNQKELQYFNQTLSEVGKVITEEIAASTAIEEQNAGAYSNALKGLRNKVEKGKRGKMLLKQRAKQKAVVHKDPTKLSLMEKLQFDLTEKTEKIVSGSAPSVEKPKIFKRQKLNASAGKRAAVKH